MLRLRVNLVLYFYLICFLFFPYIQKCGSNSKAKKKLTKNDVFDIEADSVVVLPNGEIRKTSLHQKYGEKVGKVIPKKIIGGRSTNISSVPYQVALKLDGTLFCGGVIFNKRTVVTAAHCFLDDYSIMKPKDEMIEVEVVGGEYDLIKDESTEQNIEASDVLIHPNYSQDEGEYDIALIKLKKDFKYNKQVQPLPMGYPPVLPHAQGKMIISGWGYTKVREYGGRFEDAYFPNVLKSTEIRLFNREECIATYPPSHWGSNYLAKSDLVFCGGVDKGGHDACSGDSGGPIACYSPLALYPNQKWLCGIVSTGFGCGLPKKPGFYTKIGIPDIQMWIIKKVGYADKPTLMY